MSKEQVIVYGDYGRDKNGKRIRKKFTGANEVEARMKKLEYERERAIGLHKYSDKMTVREWTEIWMTAYRSKVKGTNRVTYENYVQKLNAQIGSMKMRDVRNIHLYKALMELDGKSKSAITKYRMVIQQIFKKARQNKVIPDDPAEDIEIPDGTAGGHRALERWEVELIGENWQVYRCGLWVMIMLLTGLRRSEMIALDWDCVDMKARTLTVRRAAEIVTNQAVIKEVTKTEAGFRTLPICDMLFEALNKIPAQERTGVVCKSAHGRVISQSAFDRGIGTFNSAMERILNGEPPIQQGRRKDKEQPTKEPKERKHFSIKAHDLRYTFATALYDAGIDVKSAMYYLGHSDIRMTMNLYTQLSRERENLARAQAITFLDNWIQNKQEDKTE